MFHCGWCVTEFRNDILLRVLEGIKIRDVVSVLVFCCFLFLVLNSFLNIFVLLSFLIDKFLFRVLLGALAIILSTSYGPSKWLLRLFKGLIFGILLIHLFLSLWLELIFPTIFTCSYIIDMCYDLIIINWLPGSFNIGFPRINISICFRI